MPEDVKIQLRGRFRILGDEYTIRKFHLSRHSVFELQLEASLILGSNGEPEIWDAWCLAMLEGIAGVIIDGRLRVDDEPFWAHKIKEDEVYNIAYIQRLFWWNPLIWAIDRYGKMALVEEKDVPELNPYWETSATCARLKWQGLATRSSEETHALEMEEK